MVNEALLARISKFMKQESELELIILKGHLLIEEQLNNILEAARINQSKLGNLELQFFKKVLIANSLCWKSPDDEIWKFMLKINKLRNDLAHQLDSKKRDKLIEDVMSSHIKLLDDDLVEETKKMSMKEQIDLSICLVLGYLEIFCDDIRTVSNKIYQPGQKGPINEQ